MNREQYNSDPRYAKVLETMDLLGIMDVTTTRQHKNGTIIWKLPIKINYPGNKERLIEVGSFSTGYVRNQNSGYSNYQLNKRQFEDEYFQAYEWKDGKQVKIKNQYRKWQRKTCILIPIEIDRLEYMIKYCVKNYYIKNANQVASGEYVSKWYHEWELEQLKDKHSDALDSEHIKYNNLADAARIDYDSTRKIAKLENKLERIKTFLKHEII